MTDSCTAAPSTAPSRDSVALFAANAGAYAAFRPTYPSVLFDWLAQRCAQRERALDIGCGNGQAARALRMHFDEVIGCDASVEQLSSGEDWQGVRRLAADAEQIPVADGSLDLVVVAQALHWFATHVFFEEIRRVLRPEGFFCAWCYSLLSVTPAIDELIGTLHGDTLRGCWPEGRRSVDAGYRDIEVPFARLAAPAFALETRWNLAQLVGYLRTWSAVAKYRQLHASDPVDALLAELSSRWGAPETTRTIRWPLHLIAGYPHRCATG